jgi:hypothetical protein
MGGRVIAREFGVVIVDDAVSDAGDVVKLLDEAVALMRQEGKHALAFHMGNLVDSTVGERSAELAAYFASIAPADARVAMVHFRDAYLETLTRNAAGVLQQHGLQAYASPSPTEAEAWLRRTATPKS